MSGFVTELWSAIRDIRQTVAMLRRGIRVGVVSEVDTTACTVVVEYTGKTDANGDPARSIAMPWMQGSTEHRPPAVGDHALVIDPSFGNGSPLAFTGWPSTANPAPAGGGDQDVIFRARDAEHGDTYQGGTRSITAADVSVTADSVAVASSDVRLGENPTDYAALATQVDLLWTTLYTMFSGWAPAPMDGAAGLKAAFIAAFPSAPQSVAAEQVRVK